MNVFNVKYNVYTKKNSKTSFIVIGDLHGWISNEQIYKVVENINDQNPNIILIAGDILTESYRWLQRKPIERLQKLMKYLTESGADVVTVLGNHDTHFMSEELLKQYLSLGDIERVHPLHNTSVDLEKNGESIHVAGLVTDPIDGVTAVTNRVAKKNGIDQRPQRIIKTLEPIIDLNPDQINILLAHDPRQLRMPDVDEATKEFDVRLAAHIHNGYLPFKVTTKDQKYLDQDWAHYLFLGIPKLKERNFARGVAYGNRNFYVLCTQTNNYYLVKYNKEIGDNEYSKITIDEAIAIIKNYNLTPSIITGGINRYVGMPIEGSEVTSFELKSTEKTL